MGVDIVDGDRGDLGHLESLFHGKKGTAAVFSRRSEMMGISRISIAHQLGVYSGTSASRVLQFLWPYVRWHAADEVKGSLTSSTTQAAPSAKTNPPLSASNGLEESCGSLLNLVARLRERAKPPIANGWMQDSAPPAIMTSASPDLMNRDASPRECAPVVHAVVAVWFGPLDKTCHQYGTGGPGEGDGE